MKHSQQIVLLSLCVAVVTLVGCSKSDAPIAKPPPPPAAQSPPPATTEAPAVAPAPPGATAPAAEVPAPAGTASGSENVDLEKLTAAVQGFAKEYNAKPKDFAPLVAHGYLAAEPVAPAGKKFVIDPTTYRVSLVNK